MTLITKITCNLIVCLTLMGNVEGQIIAIIAENCTTGFSGYRGFAVSAQLSQYNNLEIIVNGNQYIQKYYYFK